MKLNSKQLPPPPERDKIETISLSESQTETELSTQTEFSIENLESGMVQIHDPDNILGGFPSTAEAQPDTIQLSRANSPVTHEDTEAEEVNTSSPVKKLKMFSCPNCGKLFSRKIYAINHCKPKEPWRCTKCFQEINQVQNIKRHVERCKKPKPHNVKSPATVLKCKECDKTYSSLYNLVRHEQKAHKAPQKKAFVCGFTTCPFRTNSEEQLKKHKTTNHTDIQKHQCKKCEYECLSTSGLKKHMLNIHRLECNNCLESFATEKQLKVHKLSFHRGDLNEVSDQNANKTQVYVSRVIGEHAHHRFSNTDDSIRSENTEETSSNSGVTSE